MILEDAINLKKGTEIIATQSWVAPGQCTKGKTYIMQRDTRIVWPGEMEQHISYRKIREKDLPCNAELPVIDDKGGLIFPSYIWFEIVN